MSEMMDTHAIITDTCRSNRGEDGVVEETMRRVEASIRALLRVWPIGPGTRVHVRVSVEVQGEQS